MGDSFEGDVCEGDVCDVASGVSSVLLGRSDGAVINLIADGVGVIGGGSIPFGFLRFLGDGVAGGGMVVTLALALDSALSLRSEFIDEDDSLIERRIDMAVVVEFVTFISRFRKMLRQISDLGIGGQYMSRLAFTHCLIVEEEESSRPVRCHHGLKT